MFIVDKSTVSPSGDSMVGEASTMGFPVGEWPEFVAVVDGNYSGFLFIKGSAFLHNGEFAGFGYWAHRGMRLVVFND